MDNYFRIYSIFDRGAEKFGPLFEANNDSVAARSYYQIMDKIDKRFRSDYVLYFVGVFDVKKGTIEAETIPQEVVVNINIPGEKI